MSTMFEEVGDWPQVGIRLPNGSRRGLVRMQGEWKQPQVFETSEVACDWVGWCAAEDVPASGSVIWYVCAGNARRGAGRWGTMITPRGWDGGGLMWQPQERHEYHEGPRLFVCEATNDAGKRRTWASVWTPGEVPGLPDLNVGTHVEVDPACVLGVLATGSALPASPYGGVMWAAMAKEGSNAVEGWIRLGPLWMLGGIQKAERLVPLSPPWEFEATERMIREAAMGGREL